MGIRSHIDRYQPLNWRLRYRVMLFLVLALVLTPAAIFATSDTFSDVPDNNFAHAAINAIFGARITTGISPGIYGPGQNVTREQMAAFLQRGLGRVAFNTSAGISLSNTFQDTAVVTITTGGAPGGTGFIKLDASLTAYTQDRTGCPCEVQFRLTQDGGGQSDLGYVTVNNPPDNFYNVGGSLTWVFPVSTASTQTFRLEVGRRGTGNVLVDGQLAALYVPFGATGGNTLNPPAMAAQAVSEAEEVKLRTTKGNN